MGFDITGMTPNAEMGKGFFGNRDAIDLYYTTGDTLNGRLLTFMISSSERTAKTLDDAKLAELHQLWWGPAVMARVAESERSYQG